MFYSSNIQFGVCLESPEHLYLDKIKFLVISRYFRSRTETYDATLEAYFDQMEWSNAKKYITNRSGIDFYTGYRSVEIL